MPDRTDAQNLILADEAGDEAQAAELYREAARTRLSSRRTDEPAELAQRALPLQDLAGDDPRRGRRLATPRHRRNVYCAATPPEGGRQSRGSPSRWIYGGQPWVYTLKHGGPM